MSWTVEIEKQTLRLEMLQKVFPDDTARTIMTCIAVVINMAVLLRAPPPRAADGIRR